MKNELVEIGGLSNPSKMPCPSYSIPASACRVGSKLRGIAGTTCTDCYACKGCYTFPSTVDAMARRLDVVRAALADSVVGDRWAENFARVLEAKRNTLKKKDGRYFRWHDSGDLQSVRHLALIVRVAQLAPNVSFWLPTREYGIVADYLRSGGEIPENLCIRLSAHYVDAAAKVPPVLADLPTSEVHTGAAPSTDAVECIAYRQEGACRDCRRCWDRGTQTISYPIH